MAFSQWWAFRWGMVEYDHEKSGVYQFADATGTVVYIGGSDNVKRRLAQHLGEDTTTCIRRKAAKYRVEYTSHYRRREKELYDEFVRKYGKPPECNDVAPRR